jgi:hypothetical protein
VQGEELSGYVSPQPDAQGSDNAECGDLNPNPLDEIGRYGTAWMIADLLRFTRRDLAVFLGVSGAARDLGCS